MSKNFKSTETGLSNQMAAVEQRFGPIEYRPIETLQSYDNNPRKHPESQLVKLMSSISEFGFAVPALVDENNVIIAGEARIAAAKRLGMREVPVIVAHQWSKAQVRAFRVADNKLAQLATWDEEVLAIEIAAIIEIGETPIEILGFETAEVDLLLDGSKGLDAAKDKADEQFEPPVNAVTRAGDIWLLGKHHMLCGSSLEAASWNELMAGETAAMVCVLTCLSMFRSRAMSAALARSNMPNSRWLRARCPSPSSSSS